MTKARMKGVTGRIFPIPRELSRRNRYTYFI
jgi:hypothetical protein